MTDVFFLILSCVTVVMAILVVCPRNPVHAALALLVMMLSLAGIFLQLTAPFLAIMQVVVYAGAIIVMFIFVIMLMNLDPVEMGEEKGFWFKAISFFLVVFLALFVAVAVFKSTEGLPQKFPTRDLKVEAQAPARGPGVLVNAENGRMPADFGSTEAMGAVLFEPYLVPFELVSVLIVIAVVGAVVLSKKRLD